MRGFGPLLALIAAVFAWAAVTGLPATGGTSAAGISIAGAATIGTKAEAAVPAAMKALYRRPEAIPYPPENPWSAAKEDLGRMLFFDPLLSGPGTLSCASCHNPAVSWTDGLALAEGVARMKWHTPSIIDVAWVPTLGWDGKFPSLEAVAFGPMLNPLIMNNTEAEIIRRLSRIPGYIEAFAKAFPQAPRESLITRFNIEQGLATFQRTIVASPAPFDRWIEGDERAISDAAKRGFILFNGKADCANCHEGPSFTDFSFHDIGLAKEGDIGRGRLFPASVKLRHAFKVPTLRDVARRAPYMHDGAIATLEEVIEAYDTAGIDRPSRSQLIRPLGLTAEEKKDLVAFMLTLTGEASPFPVPVLPR